MFYFLVVLNFFLESHDIGQKARPQLTFDVLDLTLEVLVDCFFKTPYELFGRLQDEILVLLMDQLFLFVANIFTQLFQDYLLIIFIIIGDVFQLCAKLLNVGFGF